MGIGDGGIGDGSLFPETDIEKLEIDIIELPKIIGKETINDKLLDWLYFLEEPKGERVTKKMEENEELKEAVEKLCTLSEDEKMQRIADLREKAILFRRNVCKQQCLQPFLL